MDYADKLPSRSVVHFCAAASVHNPAAVDTLSSSPLRLRGAWYARVLFEAASMRPSISGDEVGGLW